MRSLVAASLLLTCCVAQAQWLYEVQTDAVGDARTKTGELRTVVTKGPKTPAAGLRVQQIVDSPGRYNVFLMLPKAQLDCVRRCEVFVKFPAEPDFIRYDGYNASIGSLSQVRLERAEALVVLLQQSGQLTVKAPVRGAGVVDFSFVTDGLTWPLPLNPPPLADQRRAATSTQAAAP